MSNKIQLSKTVKILYKQTDYTNYFLYGAAILALLGIPCSIYSGAYIQAIGTFIFGVVCIGSVLRDREGFITRLNANLEVNTLFKINDKEYFSGTPDEFLMYIQLNDIKEFPAQDLDNPPIVHQFV